MSFITFEGGEGCGKSTQAKLLAKHFEAQGREVILTREPGGTKAAEEIREILIHNESLDPLSETLLNFAARNDHVNHIIKPALSGGKVVICDRFFDSTYVYQGHAGELDISKIDEIRNATIAGFAPDVTFILDMDVEVAVKRALDRGDANKYDKRGMEFHHKLREGFLEIAKTNGERCKLVDASKNVQDIHQQIISHL